jgi:hypothetical protein
VPLHLTIGSPNPPSPADRDQEGISQHHAWTGQKEAKLLPRLEPLIREGQLVTVNVQLTNRDRTFGTLLSQPSRSQWLHFEVFLVRTLLPRIL